MSPGMATATATATVEERSLAGLLTVNAVLYGFRLVSDIDSSLAGLSGASNRALNSHPAFAIRATCACALRRHPILAPIPDTDTRYPAPDTDTPG